MTHSAVSHSLRQLESFLGKTLVHRTTRKVSLTEEGVRYEKSVATALKSIEAATFQIMQQEEVVTVNVLHSLALKWVIPRLPAFKVTFPDINLVLSTSAQSGEPFLDNSVDIAIVYAKEAVLQNYVAHVFSEDYLVLVSSPEKVAMYSCVEECVVHEPALSVSDKIRTNDWSVWCDSAGIPLPGDSISFQSSVQAIQAAVSGLGVLVTHYLFVEKAVKQGTLVLLSDKKVITDNRYYIVTTPEHIKRPSVKKCINWLLEQRSES